MAQGLLDPAEGPNFGDRILSLLGPVTTGGLIDRLPEGQEYDRAERQIARAGLLAASNAILQHSAPSIYPRGNMIADTFRGIGQGLAAGTEAAGEQSIMQMNLASLKAQMAERSAMIASLADNAGGGPRPPAAVPIPGIAPAGAVDPYVARSQAFEGHGVPRLSDGTPASSVDGWGGFIKGTWLSTIRQMRPDLAGLPEAQLLALRGNKELAAQAVAFHRMQNAPLLAAAGFPNTPSNAAMAHSFGAGDAVRILGADAATPMEVLFPPNAKGEPHQVLRANPTYAGKTAGDMVAKHRTFFAEADSAEAARLGLPGGVTVTPAAQGVQVASAGPGGSVPLAVPPAPNAYPAPAAVPAAVPAAPGGAPAGVITHWSQLPAVDRQAARAILFAGGPNASKDAALFLAKRVDEVNLSRHSPAGHGVQINKYTGATKDAPIDQTIVQAPGEMGVGLKVTGDRVSQAVDQTIRPVAGQVGVGQKATGDLVTQATDQAFITDPRNPFNQIQKGTGQVSVRPYGPNITAPMAPGSVGPGERPGVSYWEDRAYPLGPDGPSFPTSKALAGEIPREGGYPQGATFNTHDMNTDQEKLLSLINRDYRVQAWQKAEPRYISTLDNISRGTRGGDLAAIENVLSIYDPGAVVTEGKLHLTHGIGGPAARLAAMWQTAYDAGGNASTLTDATRTDLVNMAHAEMRQRDAGRLQAMKEARNNAISQGLPSRLIEGIGAGFYTLALPQPEHGAIPGVAYAAPLRMRQGPRNAEFAHSFQPEAGRPMEPPVSSRYGASYGQPYQPQQAPGSPQGAAGGAGAGGTPPPVGPPLEGATTQLHGAAPGGAVPAPPAPPAPAASRTDDETAATIAKYRAMPPKDFQQITAQMRAGQHAADARIILEEYNRRNPNRRPRQ